MRMVCGVIGRGRYDVCRSSDTRNDCIDRHVRMEQLERVVGMTRSERLEIIKDKRMQMHALSTFDVEWLIEQAELIETYEKSIKGYALAVEIYSEMPLEQAMKKLLEIVKEEA